MPWGTDKEGDEYTDEEVAFIKAVDRWRSKHPRRFPTLTDLLRMLKELGYRKPDEKEEK